MYTFKSIECISHAVEYSVMYIARLTDAYKILIANLTGARNAVATSYIAGGVAGTNHNKEEILHLL